jgi:hypothetical protein
MPAQPQPDSLGVPVTSKTYASFVGGVNCVAEKGAPARRFRAGSAGNLAVVYADKSTDTITGLLAGETVEGQFAAIVEAGTTVTSGTVFW